MKKSYWTKKYLLDYIKTKALPIKKVFYLRYKLLFIFNNVTSYAIYAKNIL